MYDTTAVALIVPIIHKGHRIVAPVYKLLSLTIQGLIELILEVLHALLGKVLILQPLVPLLRGELRHLRQHLHATPTPTTTTTTRTTVTYGALSLIHI